jgi:hypothetical protein
MMKTEAQVARKLRTMEKDVAKYDRIIRQQCKDRRDGKPVYTPDVDRSRLVAMVGRDVLRWVLGIDR